MEINKIKNKLIYFAARGEADPIRILLSEIKIEFIEESVTGKDLNNIGWQKKLPFGEVPCWVDESGITITHCNPILRYLAKKSNLAGTSLKEEVLCDMWCEETSRILKQFWEAEFMCEKLISSNQQLQMKDKFCNSFLVPKLKQITRMMAENESAYLVGKCLTYADIKMFSVLDAINKELPLVLPSFPLLEAFYNHIGSRPKILEFISSSKRY